MYGITETTVHVTYRPIALADVEAGAGSVIGVPIPDLRRRAARRRTAARADRRAGRAVRRRRRRRARLPRAPRADRRALRARSVRRATAATAVPHRRPGAAPRERRPRVPRPHRRPGQDPRLPDRARRDRGGARPAPGVGETRGARARGRRRATSGSSPTSSPAQSRTTLVEELKRPPQGAAARVHGAGALRARSPRCRSRPTARSTARRCPRPSSAATSRAGRTSRRGRRPRRRSPGSGRRCSASPRVGDRRQLLRARRRLDPQHPGHRAVPRRPACSFTPRDLSKQPTIAELAADVVAIRGTATHGGAGGAARARRADADPALVLRAATSPTRTTGTRRSCSRSRRTSTSTRSSEALGQVVGTPRRAPPARVARTAAGAGRMSYDASRDRAVDRARSTSRRSRRKIARRAIERPPATAQARLDLAARAARSPRCTSTAATATPAGSCSSSTTSRSTASPGGSCSRTSRPRTDALRQAHAVQLPPRSASFRRWSQALADYAATARSAAHRSRAGWRSTPSTATLPTDGPTTARTREEHARDGRRSSLDADETEALLQRVPAAYRTQINDVLLTALALALRAWTGRESHRVDLEGHGREEWIGRRRPVADRRLVHDALSRGPRPRRAPKTTARR